MEKHFMIRCRSYGFVSEKENESFHMPLRDIHLSKTLESAIKSPACFTRVTFPAKSETTTPLIKSPPTTRHDSLGCCTLATISLEEISETKYSLEKINW